MESQIGTPTEYNLGLIIIELLLSNLSNFVECTIRDHIQFLITVSGKKKFPIIDNPVYLVSGIVCPSICNDYFLILLIPDIPTLS